MQSVFSPSPRITSHHKMLPPHSSVTVCDAARQSHVGMWKSNLQHCTLCLDNVKLSRTAENLTGSMGMLLMEGGQDKFGGKEEKKGVTRS